MGENGGAAFILAYLIAVVIVGLPVMLLEVSAGRLVLGGPVGTFRHIHPRATVLGWLVVGLTVVITSYYLVVTGWTLGYAVHSVAGAVEPFEEFTSGYASLWYFLVVALGVGLVLLRGLAGIERIARYLMPFLLLSVLVLVTYGLFTDGREQAAEFLLQPDFSRLTQADLWLFAVGQAFYSLAIGQGYLITYGSYLPSFVHIPRASAAVALVETSVALLAGWMLFPLVFSQGLEPDQGSQLAFNTLPRALDPLAAGWLLAAIFFPLLFFAAFSSSIAGMKVVLTAVEDELGLTRVRAVALATGVLILLGTPSALSFTPVDLRIAGEPFLEVMDRVGATQVVVVSGIVGASVLSWLIPSHRYQRALGRGALPWGRAAVLLGRSLPLAAVTALALAAVF